MDLTDGGPTRFDPRARVDARVAPATGWGGLVMKRILRGWPLVFAVAVHLAVIAGAVFFTFRDRESAPDESGHIIPIATTDASRVSPARPTDVSERKGMPQQSGLHDSGIAGDPILDFLLATEADHSESEDFGRMKGDADVFMSGNGAVPAIGVGGGGGGAAGGRMGGRRNLRAAGGGQQGGAASGQKPESNTEEYKHHADNPFRRVGDAPLSTFSIDVDTASYANIRRFLAEGRMPPKDAVRIEEMLNYFRYDYAAPKDGRPFSTHVECHAAPWAPKHRLVRIGIRGRDIDLSEAPAANLVFLVDVSGSMEPEDRLPLVKRSLLMLVETLRARDRVALVTYAGGTRVVLESTSGAEKERIAEAIGQLGAGGSTNGASGIRLAYRIATENFRDGAVNRVILCTDGDFNVGVTSEGELTRLIEEKRQTGVFLSVLGFGRGNLADARMQALAQTGNGNAAYIDSLKEAKKVLVEQASGTLMTIAKDVKIQVEFNPARVAGYRLIGYESRVLAAQDFNDDRKDAGEIGAGHQVTALYEVIPAGQVVPGAAVDALRYQTPPDRAPGAATDEWMTVKLRWKKPDGDVSDKIELPFTPAAKDEGATPDFDFAAAGAMAGMILRDSSEKGGANWGLVAELAKGGIGKDEGGYRAEFAGMALGRVGK
jgi:Ca-activated chloride channel family protein